MPTKTKSPILRRRIDSVFLFSAEASRCNGEPNDGGRPRVDPETDHLQWNDAALKRFIREGLLQEKGDVPGWAVQQQHNYPLNRTQTDALKALGIEAPTEVEETESEEGDGDDENETPKAKKAKKQGNGKGRKLTPEEKLRVLGWAAQNFADVRWFGSVMDTGYQCGNLTGPLQFLIAQSVHAATILEQGVTRVTVTREDDLASVKDREMGTKFVVPFALFRGMWCYTPAYGEKTGFSVEDMAAFIDIMRSPFSYRQSASLGLVTLRKAWLFVHDSARGNEQQGLLNDRVLVSTNATAPRSMKDFSISFNASGMSGVKVFTEEDYKGFIAELEANPGKAPA